MGWALGLPGVINVSRGADGHPGVAEFTIRADTPQSTRDKIACARPDGIVVEFVVRPTAAVSTPPGGSL